MFFSIAQAGRQTMDLLISPKQCLRPLSYCALYNLWECVKSTQVHLVSIINVQIFLVTSSPGEAPDQALLEVVQFDSNEGSLRFIIPAPKSQVSAASIFYVNTIFLDGWSPPS